MGWGRDKLIQHFGGEPEVNKSLSRLSVNRRIVLK
jgi:hypothetical protein